MRTGNVRTVLKEPLTQKDLAQHSGTAALQIDPTTFVLAEMKLCSWLKHMV